MTSESHEVPSDGAPAQPSRPNPILEPYITIEFGDHQTQPDPPSNNHRRPYSEPHSSKNSEWLSLAMSFCFAAMSMASQTLSTGAPNHLPLSFHMAGLGVVFSLAAFVLCKYIPAVRMRREAQFLENMGVFFGITAFLLDITISFPLCLKVFACAVHLGLHHEIFPDSLKK
ncbi:hypothetical protein M9H77_28897 [Catharanthus roseus]|uniref:Uncharacterized protein n=1 Tax=Catharanthus roseus TaxID=4058 RepID=A0ACC0AIW3_CATRO|nr:hypothetical protein M9H77_28897 [Catharanthus roseus]